MFNLTGVALLIMITRVFSCHLSRRLASILRHLHLAVVLDILLVIVVRRHLDKPAALDLDHLPHVLLGGEHELVVDEPAWQRLEQAAVWVYVHCLLMLGRLVRAGLAQFGRVVEEASRDALAYGHRVRLARDHLDLYALGQVEQLIAHVARPLHRTVLYEVLVAPLYRVVGVFPLLVDLIMD